MLTPGFVSGGKPNAHEFTREEWEAEGRQPPWDEWIILRDREKPQGKKNEGYDFDSYVPWHLRGDFRLLNLVDMDERRAQWLAYHKRYDEIMELRWMAAAKNNAINDRHK